MIYIIGALLLTTAVCLGVFMLRADRVSIEGEAEVCFRYGENDVSQFLESADRDELAAIADGKRLYRDDPSCGFDEDVSVRFGAQTFCIARDRIGVGGDSAGATLAVGLCLMTASFMHKSCARPVLRSC